LALVLYILSTFSCDRTGDVVDILRCIG